MPYLLLIAVKYGAMVMTEIEYLEAPPMHLYAIC